MASGLSSLLGALAACLALTVTGCASFKPQPISPAHTAAALEGRTLDNPRLQQFIEAALGRGRKADETPAWDVSRLVLAALYYHPDLDIARAKLAVAQAGVITAQQVPNPNLGIGLGYNGSVATPTPWTIGSIVNFLVETFGRRQYRTAQAEALTQAARKDLATAAWQVRGRVRTALLDLWAAGQQRGLIQQRLDLQDQLVGLLERRLAVGEASSLDVTRERVIRDQINLALRAAERLSAEARGRLATAVGVPLRAFDGVQLALDAFDHPAQALSAAQGGEARRAALLGRTDVQGLLAQYAAAQSSLQLQIAAQYPNLSVGPGYRYDQGAQKYSLDFSTQLPIFNQNQGPIAEAAARRTEAASRFEALQARIIGSIDTATTSYRAEALALDTADALVKGAVIRERQIARSFAAGQTDRPTLVTAELELAAIRLSRSDVVIRQRQALAALEDALQQPLFDPRRWPSAGEQNPRVVPTQPSS